MFQPMKIIIVSPSLNLNENVSGISSVTQFIINHNKNHDYVHFTIGKRDNDKRNFRWLTSILVLYMKWLYVLATQKEILIHFNLALSRNSIIRDFPILMMARISGKRMILHIHGGNFLMHRKHPEWMNYLLKIIFSGRHPVIVLSALEKEIIQNKFNRQRIHILPNCVELNDALSFNRTYKKDRPVILFLGRISSDKGIEYIYNATHTLKTNNIQFKFILAGKGPEEKIFIPKFRELLGNDFEFKGVVSGDNKTTLLKECDIFLLPSFYEGLPMALIESMSFGLVPVITNVGSIKYVVKHGENGLFIQSHSSVDISDAIENLAKNNEYLVTLSKNARQFIFRNFNPEAYITRLNEIYQYE